MATSSQSENSSSQSSPIRGSRKVGIVAVLVTLFLLVIVLRETGTLALNLYQSEFKTKFNYQINRGYGTNKLTPSAGNSGPINATAAEEVRSQLQQEFPQISVDFQRLSISGPYWVPLRKQLKCEFSVILQFPGGHSRITGTVDGALTGLCSAYELQHIIGRRIARTIEQILRK